MVKQGRERKFRGALKNVERISFARSLFQITEGLIQEVAGLFIKTFSYIINDIIKKNGGASDLCRMGGGKTDPKMSISHQFLILSRYQQKLNTESTTAGHLNISPRALVCVYTQGRRACRYKVCRVVKSAPWQWVLRATRCQYLIILSKRLRLRSIPLCDRLSVQPFSQATEKRE